MKFLSAHTLMVQGTTSDAGKSILVTALCRILARHNISVAPFKPQNMALNSAVTVEGGEIGRAQAVQAEACYLAPLIQMNPVLLKPNSDSGAQVIVNGKAIGNMKAREYHQYKPELLNTVVDAHNKLSSQYQVIIVEGAGSPAEINLREHDIANMGFAEKIDCPVIIVADIDRGGVFAHLYGTYQLLGPSEKQRVIGFVINRFRGDVSLLEPGLKWLEQQTSVPTLAVIPYLHDLHIEAEDSITQSQKNNRGDVKLLKVVIPSYPRISNHTDFDVLRMHPRVDCEFIKEANAFVAADLIVLAGSKNVRGDLQWIIENGWQAIIEKHLRYGGKVIGVCGGYQMLGEAIHDPASVESKAGSSDGLGLLALQSTLMDNKTLRNVRGNSLRTGNIVTGYEIHAGISEGEELSAPLFSLKADGEQQAFKEGSVNRDNNVLGTYVHGVFDEPELLAELLAWAGLETTEVFDYPAYREQQIDHLADEVEKVLPIEKLRHFLSMAVA